MRKEDIFFDAITQIRPELIEEALDHSLPQRVVPWRRCVALAACLALVATVGLTALRAGFFGGVGGGNCAADQAVNSSASMSTTTSAASGAADSGKMGSVMEETVTQDSAASLPANGSTASREETEEEAMTFGAVVLRAEDAWLLVEPLENEAIRASSDRFMVSLAGVEELPQLQKGDEIAITFSGLIRESYPAQIDAVAINSLLRELGKD